MVHVNLSISERKKHKPTYEKRKVELFSTQQDAEKFSSLQLFLAMKSWPYCLLRMAGKVLRATTSIARIPEENTRQIRK